MPAASPDVETLALIASISVVVVPLLTFKPSHEADSVSVQVNVPPVGLVILNVWANGVAPPAVPEKLRLTGFRSMLGVDVVVEDVDVAVVPETAKLTATGVTWLLPFLSVTVMLTVPL